MNKNKEIIVATFPVRYKKILEFIQKKKKDDVKYQIINLEGIRDPISFIKGAWCLKKLGFYLPSGFNLSDIDAFLCYHEDFIFIETKKNPDALNAKQLAAYIQLAKSTKGTVFILFGENCNPNSYIRIDENNPLGSEVIRTNLREFQGILRSCCISAQNEYDKLNNEITWHLKCVEADELIERAKKQYKNL
ncbi:hypothetical protein bcgnr5378_06200 [Bacillus cereus]|uniref:Uncharacterized protein n=1 Tax=Bacillus cereus TaxID=1396 RepID=A0A164LAR0_BACCE|nr:hypothetical protein [Bacillus cereus]KZD55610.1 hypothetical protein B4088_5355 [Bacillus cereus]